LEIDIMSQKEVGIPGALAVPQTREAMQERANLTVQAGLWPQGMTPNQKGLTVQVALAYGLDPLMGELVLYQGKPLITLNARRRKDVEAGHHPSIKFRFLTAEEKQGYLEAGAINEGDLVQVGILTTEWGNSVEGIGKVTKAEREVTSPRSRDHRGLAHPIVADNPIEMCQKRAETRARLMAYGPIPLPERIGISMSEMVAQGVTVEGEVVGPGDAAPARLPAGEPRPGTAQAGDAPPAPPREARDPERDINELYGDGIPHEAEPPAAVGVFDPETAPPPPLPEHVRAITHFEAILKERGWDMKRVEADILHQPVAIYLRSHSLDQVYQMFKKALAGVAQ
jgi:hypothetical protein